MAETTPNLGLPLVQAAQAQKHVTVNEGLARIDALAQLTLLDVDLSSAPVTASEGDAFGIGATASGDWAGQEGRVAVFAGGGWVFVTPRTGWRAWVVSEASVATFDGVGWTPGAGSVSASGAAFVHRSVEVDHAVTSGASSSVAGAIPGDAVVYGVTGRVTADIGGATSFRLGVSGGVDRYGSGIGVSNGAWLRGITGSPLAYYAATDLILSADGGAFDGTGAVRLVVHFAELTLPRAG